MAFRVEYTDGTSVDYDDASFDVVGGGALVVTSFGMRVTHAPHVWRRVLEQRGRM